MGITFGENARKMVQRGDLVCSFQYVNGEEAACFFPLNRIAKHGAGAYVICLSAAWKYGQEDRKGIQFLMQQAKIAASTMGFDANSKFVVNRIMGFMQDMLIELLTMKPAPDSIAPRAPEVADVRMDGNKMHVELVH